MKILITNSPLHHSHGHTFTQADWPTLVLPTLAGLCGIKHQIRIADNMTCVWRSNRVLEEITAFKPDLMFISIIAGRDINNTVRLIKQVREANWYPQHIIAGGQGASFYHEMLLDAGVDAVIQGEGELAIPDMLRDGPRFGVVPARPMIASLDHAPFPRWDLMPLRKSLWFPGRFTGSVETSRGCPYDCNFCAITSYWQRTFRRKSPERIVAEMDMLVRSGRSHIYLADDNFGMGEKHHADLFELILKRGLDVRFFAQMRTDTIANHPDLIALAARAGLYGALIGYDTYDPGMFHHITKVGSIELNERCTEVMRRNKLMIFGSHIYGLPSQAKPQDFAPTFWRGRRNSDLFRMPHFSLLPGTKLYQQTVPVAMALPDSGDARLFIRPLAERRRFARWYTLYNLLHILLPDEWLGALFHRNRNVRILKRRGYVGIARHWFYRLTGVLE